MGIKSGVGDKVAPWIEWICSQVVRGKKRGEREKNCLSLIFVGEKEVGG